MGENKTRVDFNAPESVIERADRVAELLDTSRTRLLIDALEAELEDIVSDEAFRRKVREAYYDGRTDFETVRTVLGSEEATRIKLLRESLERDPAEPQLDGDLPAEGAFYEGTRPEWPPDEESADDEAKTQP